MKLAVGHGWRPGLIGEIVHAHGIYYAREWGFGAYFEAKVARELGEFVDRYVATTDRLFYVDRADRMLGAVTVDGGDPSLTPGQAHLRWFIVTDEARGSGHGRKLLDAAAAFLKSAGFASCYLTTFAGLDPARRLYEDAGFVLTREYEAETWGRSVREQRFDLDVAG